MVYQLKEFIIIIRGKPRIWQAVLTHYMVSEEMLVEKAVSEVGIYRGFKEASDKESQGSYSYIHQTKSSNFSAPVQDQL